MYYYLVGIIFGGIGSNKFRMTTNINYKHKVQLSNIYIHKLRSVQK